MMGACPAARHSTTSPAIATRNKDGYTTDVHWCANDTMPRWHRCDRHRSRVLPPRLSDRWNDATHGATCVRGAWACLWLWG